MIIEPFRETLLEDYSGDTSKEQDLFKFFSNYVNILEGIKTQTKNVHWASLKLPNRDRRGAHLYLDDFLEVVQNFQDMVAECAMGITGKSFDFNTVQGVSFPASSTREFMKYVLSRTTEFYNNIPQTTECAGIKSETETFIASLNQYAFRFELTE